MKKRRNKNTKRKKGGIKYRDFYFCRTWIVELLLEPSPPLHEKAGLGLSMLHGGGTEVWGNKRTIKNTDPVVVETRQSLLLLL